MVSMADQRLKAFSLLEDEESDDIDLLVENVGKKEASRDAVVEKVNEKTQLNSEAEKEKPLTEIENPLMEDINGDDQGWKSCSDRRRKGRSPIGKSKVDTTENSDKDREYKCLEVEESSISLVYSENGEEDQLAEEIVREEAIEENSKHGRKRRGRRKKSKAKKPLQNEGVFARVVKLAAAGLCFLVFALFFIAIAMS